MRPERVLIVGGGIGGMAVAAALSRLEIPFLLLERSERLGEVGSGLGVLPGAIRALETLGVDRPALDGGAPFRRFRIASAGGRDLAEVDFGRVFAAAGRTGFVMRRAALHRGLAGVVDPAHVRLGAEVSWTEQHGGEAVLELGGGEETVSGDLLVGADGLRSAVRRHVLDDGPPRYAGETIFRGIAEHRLERAELSREVFGRGRRAAYYELEPGRVYWWATSPLPEGTRIPPERRHEHLATAFESWPFGLPHLFAATPAESILQNDIYDRRPARRWHRGRAVLTGDAAHPTTPNLGQGACMAIEDAVVLARCIAAAGTPEQAFTDFHAARARRTTRTVRISRLWGNAGLWRRRTAVWARDTAFRSTPSSLLERQALAQFR